MVTLTASPTTGYSFTGWSGDLTGSTNPATITMSANRTVTANFAINTYTITPSAGTGGAISPSTAVTVNYGASQAFSVTANSGYSINQVLVDGVAATLTAGVYTFNNVTANHTIVASFTANSYTITASSGTGGTISPSGSVSVNYGSSKTFTVTPKSGYKIASVLVDGTSQGAVSTYTFTNLTAAHTIAASFAVIPPAVPLAPTGLTATAISGRKITLVWKDNSTNETGFKIERSTNGTTFSQIATVKVNVTSYTNSSLTSGRTYYYRVRAYSSTGNSGYSNTAQARAVR